MTKSNNKKLDKQVKNSAKAIISSLEKDLFGPKPKSIRKPKIGDRLKDVYVTFETGTVVSYDEKLQQYHIYWEGPGASYKSEYTSASIMWFLQSGNFVYIANPNKIWKDLNS